MNALATVSHILYKSSNSILATVRRRAPSATAATPSPILRRLQPRTLSGIRRLRDPSAAGLCPHRPKQRVSIPCIEAHAPHSRQGWKDNSCGRRRHSDRRPYRLRQHLDHLQ